MKGRNKMDKDAKKNERELRKYRAKLRMDYYPLPLRWFKFFRYVSMILNIISCISGIISYILIAATINNPEAIEKIQASFTGMNMELFTVITVADFLVTVYLLVLCVLVFKRIDVYKRQAFDPDYPLSKTNNAVLMFADSPVYEPSDCIRCGKCVKACSMNLLPTELEHAFDMRDARQLEKLKVNLCVNCGACSFVCPAKRNLAEKNQLAKAFLRERSTRKGK